MEAEGELKSIYHNTRRMLSLVDQLLLFQKAESGLDRLRVTKIDLNVLVKNVYLSFTQMAQSKKNRLPVASRQAGYLNIC